MRGSYRGSERAEAARSFREVVIPDFLRNEVEPLRKFVHDRKGMVVVDVGANKGVFAKGVIDLFDVSHVYMFDASRENFLELQNQKDNLVFDESDFSKLSAFHSAVGARSGTITLYTNEDGSPLGSVYKHEVAGEKPFFSLDKAYEVPLASLDWLVSHDLRLPHIDVLKIDTEGSEYDILLGAENLIRNGLIDLVHFEFGLHQADSRNFFRDFYSFFKKYGYKLHIIDNGMVFPIEKYEYRFENFGIIVTFIAERQNAKS